ncbi:universal stress protein [Oceanobacillus halotolerans]|uniref:universal stress protein n=1 Tax=Oceanobacillus halotolerans TaxID=2663380 RepID=UPI0013D97B66|nr:universal stress protein [Oceanobacillus halotolerans]
MYHKILLATDGSNHAIRAEENALTLAKGNSNSSIEVVYVVDAEKAKSDVLNYWNRTDLTDTRQGRLNEFEQIAKKAGVNYKINILRGEPGPAIVDYANRNNFDVVVIGSRGLNTLQEFVLGSVSHKVVKEVKCPVLIVK